MHTLEGVMFATPSKKVGHTQGGQQASGQPDSGHPCHVTHKARAKGETAHPVCKKRGAGCKTPSNILVLLEEGNP